VDDAEQIDEEGDAIEDWQRPQTRFQWVLCLEDETVDEHHETNTHCTAENRGDEPRSDNCSWKKIR
jgi:hypothetical protein